MVPQLLIESWWRALNHQWLFSNATARWSVAVSWLFPELAWFADDKQSNESLKRAFSDLFEGRPRLRRVRLIIVASFGVAITAVLLLTDSPVSHLVLHGQRWWLVVFVLMVVLLQITFGSALTILLFRRRLRLSLRRQLRAKGVILCLNCGYSLTGNESGRCPECGDGLEA